MALPNNPNTRKEMYLSNIAGQGTTLPSEPHTREEEYLDYIAKNGGGGTGDGDMKKSVYDSDLAVSGAGGIKAFVNGQTNDLQPKTLNTPITIGGVSRTTVEAALGALEDNKEDTILAATPLVKEYDEVMRQDVLRLTMDNTPTEDSGNPVTSDGVKAALSATVDLMKDTTGWIGGNLLPITLDDIKSVNKGGTWTGNTYVYNGLTYTFDITANGYVSKVNINGLTSARADFLLMSLGMIEDTFLSHIGERLTISGCPEGGEQPNGYWVNAQGLETDGIGAMDTGSGASFTVRDFSNYNTVAIKISVAQGVTMTNKVFSPMISDAEQYALNPAYRPYHESVEDWYWSENAKKSVHNIFNPSLFISGADANMATVNSDGSSIRVKIDSAGTFRLCAWYLNVTPNTDYTVKTSVAITSGKCAIKVETTGGTNIKTSDALSADGDIEMTFNSGNNTRLKFDIFCTWDVSAIGDVTCNNLFIKETADTYNNFMPFAMTNRELTEKVFEKRVLTSADDLNDVTETGIYGVTTAPANSPDNQTYYALIVQKSSNADIRQVVIKGGSSSAIYVRSYGGSPATWSSWVKFTGTVVS